MDPLIGIPSIGPEPAPADGPSHWYSFDRKDLVRNLAATLGLLLVAGIGALGLLWSGWAGRPALLGDPDATILGTKARLASGISEARMAFVGDSSCLINVDIPTLRSAGIDAVNLGTLSYLGIDDFGLLAQRFCATHTGPLEVVLVVHPECLRLAQPSARHRTLLATALDSPEPSWRFRRESLAEALGFEDLRERWMDRVLPTPMRGGLGRRYGFTRDLQRELLRQGGTLEETAHYDPTPAAASGASAEYRIAPRIRSECQRFRTRLPGGVSLRLIVSPVPRSHALRNHEATVAGMSDTVAGWLGAPGSDHALPSILPDGDFGTPTHLRPEAARRYTRRLAESMLSGSKPEPPNRHPSP